MGSAGRPAGGCVRPRAICGWPLALLGGVHAIAAAVGCGGRPDASARAAAPVLRARARPESGPWFVDRARDYGLDVVTRCGGPEKRSVVESLGTGVALFDSDGDGDLDLFVAATSQVRDGMIR